MPSRCNWSKRNCGAGGAVRSSGTALAETAELAIQFVGKLLKLRRAAGDQDQVAMVFGKKLSQFVSNSAGSAGDESGLVHVG